MTHTTGFVLAASLLASGCGLTPSEAAQDGSMAKKDQPIVIINEVAFPICPAFAPDRSLTVFDAQSWQAHTKVAVVQPNKLNNWNPDLSLSTLLRYADGHKPSAGYRVKLDGTIRNVDSVLTIPVRLIAPKPDMVAAAVLTSPCLYLQVTGRGYSGVSVVNTETGEVLKNLAL
ncbi:MAG: protease complex subunit PrcB family protein [Burkholderiaceae bacterium]